MTRVQCPTIRPGCSSGTTPAALEPQDRATVRAASAADQKPPEHRRSGLTRNPEHIRRAICLKSCPGARLPHNSPGTRKYQVIIAPPGAPALTTQLYFPDDRDNDRDCIFDQRLVFDIIQNAGIKIDRFDFVVEAG